MRLFMAIELPKEVQAQIYNSLGDLRRAVKGIRWVSQENLHITLKFLGEVGIEKTFPIQTCMEDVVRTGNFSCFDLELAGVGAFPSLNRPRVIWMGVTKGQEVISKIAHDVENRLEGLGYPKEDRPYTAHLTLGRVNEPKRVTDFKEKAAGYEKTSFASGSVGMISLMQSFLSQGGAVYKRIHEIPLK